MVAKIEIEISKFNDVISVEYVTYIAEITCRYITLNRETFYLMIQYTQTTVWKIFIITIFATVVHLNNLRKSLHKSMAL